MASSLRGPVWFLLLSRLIGCFSDPRFLVARRRPCVVWLASLGSLVALPFWTSVGGCHLDYGSVNP